MRTAGFAPSLGAGGSLVAASVVVALLASALLAFHDWPSGAPHAGAGTATLPSAATPRTHRSAAPAVARGSAAPAAAARPARRSATTAGSARRPAAAPRRGRLPVPASSPAATSPSSTPATTHAPARNPSPTAANLSTPAPTLSATGPVGGTAQTVRKVVAPVVKRLPPPVQAPVNAVGDTVQHVGDGVDGALGNAEIRLP